MLCTRRNLMLVFVREFLLFLFVDVLMQRPDDDSVPEED